MSSEASAGYFKDDGVDDSSERCKRRPTAIMDSPASVAVAEDLQQLLLQEFFGSTSPEDFFEDFNFFFQESVISDQNTFNHSNPIKQFYSEEKVTEQKAAMKAQKDKEEEEKEEEKEEEESEEKMIRKKKKKEKVAYPFAVLKPAELEGDLTLAEINDRILRRPTRPVRHPVGEFACSPWVPDGGGGGPGLSGKVVVGLTRIRTKGRGSITVIRTRG